MRLLELLFIVADKYFKGGFIFIGLYYPMTLFYLLIAMIGVFLHKHCLKIHLSVTDYVVCIHHHLANELSCGFLPIDHLFEL